MSSNEVWAEGLLVFYDVFKWLENMLDTTENEALQALDNPAMRRTAFFEKVQLSYHC